MPARDASLLQQAEAIGERLRGWRRHLHANPELSGQEAQTAQYIAAELRAMGYQPVENVGGAHGVVAEAHGGAGPFVALRADTDALPIHEETGLPFSSRNPGVMHACGHDAHTAMLLGAALLIHNNRAALRRPVRLVFQPHEEKYPGGAPAMIAGGALAGVDQIFGIHITSQLPSGQFAIRSGPMMAAVNELAIDVHGKGGHAAKPEDCVDPVVISAEIILALQTIVSRSISLTEPAVVSVTQVRAGTADNVIPERVELRGTIRTYDERARATILRRVREIAEGLARVHGGNAVVRLGDGYPVLVNDREVTERALGVAQQVGFAPDVLKTMPLQGGGEDFAYYGQKAPAAFGFLGAHDPARGPAYPHHHPKFDIDEAMLARGAALHAAFALQG
jgi:amidohydrolase